MTSQILATSKYVVDGSTQFDAINLVEEFQVMMVFC